MEATGSSTYYQKATNMDEDVPEFNPHGKIPGEVKEEKGFGGDISSICIAPFEED